MFIRIKKFINDEGGAFANIIDEITSSTLAIVLILTVFISVIAISVTNIRTVIEKSTSQDKIMIQSSLTTTGASEVLGQDVIASIRYYASDSSVQVSVSNKNGNMTYTNSTYTTGFSIGYKDTYVVSYERDSDGNIIKCNYTLKN